MQLNTSPTAAPPSSTRPRQLATSLIVFGCFVGVIGMVGFFSWPGIALIGLGHALILVGSVWGRSWRTSLFGVLGIAVIWAMVYRGAVTQLL